MQLSFNLTSFLHPDVKDNYDMKPFSIYLTRDCFKSETKKIINFIMKTNKKKKQSAPGY